MAICNMKRGRRELTPYFNADAVDRYRAFHCLPVVCFGVTAQNFTELL